MAADTDVQNAGFTLCPGADYPRLRRRPALRQIGVMAGGGGFCCRIFHLLMRRMMLARRIGDLFARSRKPSHGIGQSNAVLVCQRHADLRAEVNNR